jgi:hypothetical protein
MNRTKTFLLLILMIIATAAGAQTFKAGTFRYKVIGKNTVEVASADSSMSGNVAIPQTVRLGDTVYTVTAIADNGFGGCTGIRSIILPAKITRIGKEAFINCLNLNSINIPYGVKEIKDGTFCHCEALAGLTVPDGVTKLGKYALAHCKNITRFNVPDACKEIGDKAFYNCQKLQALVISASVEKIGIRALQGCPELRRINVEPENKHFTSQNDILYNKAMTNLIKYPGNIDEAMFEMPSSVKTVEEYAFENVKKLLVVKVSPSCTKIDNMAFVNCEKLQKAVCPPSLHQVGMDSFFGCIMLDLNSIPGDDFTEFDYKKGLVEKYE